MTGHQFFARGLLAAASIPLCGGGAVAKNIEGQIFIATQGGQVIKLALVEVRAFDKSEVEERIAEVDKKLAADREQTAALLNAARKLSEQADAAYKKAFSDHLKIGVLDKPSKAAWYAAGKFMMDTGDLVDAISKRNRYLLSSKRYFDAIVSMTPLASAKTDADGNFILSAIDEKTEVAVTAIASQRVGDKLEDYCWIVNSSHEDTPMLFLSNDNLADSASPSGSLVKAITNADPSEPPSLEVLRERSNALLAKHGLADRGQRRNARRKPSHRHRHRHRVHPKGTPTTQLRQTLLRDVEISTD